MAASNILEFKPKSAMTGHTPKSLFERVKHTGCVILGGTDHSTKIIAAGLRSINLVAVEAISDQGDFRILTPQECLRSNDGRPWRVRTPKSAA